MFGPSSIPYQDSVSSGGDRPWKYRTLRRVVRRNVLPALRHTTAELLRYDTYKRIIDVVGATLLLAIHIPLMVLVGILVRAGSRGPVIYRQQRLTGGCKVFTMYKFRTMRLDAEKSSGAVWAAESDPRVTTLGKILRKARIDELPQLVNVISGDMSLIGPRPERPEIAIELARKFPSFSRRLDARAGISGLAQTASGYASCLQSYKRKLALDILYVNNKSFLLDIRIAIKTVWVVISGFGAR